MGLQPPVTADDEERQRLLQYGPGAQMVNTKAPPSDQPPGTGGSEPYQPSGPSGPSGYTPDPSQYTPHPKTGSPGTSPSQGPAFSGQGQALGSTLQQMYASWAKPQQFQGPQQGNVAAPQWQPGVNPFSQTFQGQMLGQAYRPSQFDSQFAPNQFQGTYSAVNAPQTQFTPGVSTPQNQLAQQTQSALGSWLSNPSSFGAPQVQQSYDYLSQNIDDRYKQQQQLLEEDMARRGLADSSIRGGRLSDLNVANKSAHEQLANNLLNQQALTGGQDRSAAIGAAMGYGNQLVGQGLQQQQLQGQFNQQNFQQSLEHAAFQGDQNAMAVLQNMNVAGFNNQAGQQGFQNQLSSYGANQNAGQQGFQNVLAQLGYNQGVGQQGFQNQLAGFNANLGLANQGFQNNLASAQFGQNQNQQNFQNSLAGYGANLGANQQGFNQQQGLLQNMLGYEQQGFNNQLAGWQANNQSNQWYQQLLAQIAMAGGQ